MSSAVYEGQGTFRSTISRTDPQGIVQERTTQQVTPTEVAPKPPTSSVSGNARVRRWGPDGDSLKTVEKPAAPSTSAQPTTAIPTQDSPLVPPSHVEATSLPTRDTALDAESQRKRELAAALFGANATENK